MTTYREMQQELERLHQAAESTRRKEKGAALERIRALIAEWDLQPEELGLVEPAVVKYRDPETGATWSGRGRAPKWIVDKDRAAFEVKSS